MNIFGSYSVNRFLILLFLYPLVLLAQVGDTSAYARLNDPKYLQAYYRLAGDALDYSGNGRHGTWTGTEAYALGQFGKDQAKFSSSSVTHASVSTNTISYWRASTHVVFVGSTQYVNGRLSSGETIRATATTIASGYTGTLGSVRYYNIALSPAEIEQLYALDSRPPVPQIALEQPFDTLPDKSDPTLMGAWLNSATWQANDYSANARNGTATAVQWNRIGGRFNGNTSKINTGSDSIGTNVTTLSCWIVPFSAGKLSVGVILSNGKFEFNLLGASSKLRFSNNGGTDVLSSDVIPNFSYGNPYYVCLIRNNTNIYFYANGILLTASTTVGSPESGLYNVTIGDRNDSTRTFDGFIKDVRIYSEAKSAAWVAAEYAKSVPDPSIMLWLNNGRDISRYRRALTKYNVVTGNGPMKFNGIDSYISTPDFIGTNDFTATVWFRANSHGEGSDGGRFIDAGNIIFKLKATKQYAYTSNGGATEYAVNGTYLFPQWMCVSVIRNGSTCYIYQNGSLIGSGSSGTPGATSTFYIGNTSAFTKTFDGLLGPLIIRSRVQTADEIKAEYESLKTYF